MEGEGSLGLGWRGRLPEELAPDIDSDRQSPTMLLHVGSEQRFGVGFWAACFFEDLAPAHAGGMGESESELLAVGPHLATGVVAGMVPTLQGTGESFEEVLKGEIELGGTLVHEIVYLSYIKDTLQIR